ncbi:hypothetical protein IT157_02925 [bacterium]|nr:hypothetical protein [bacterium]
MLLQNLSHPTSLQNTPQTEQDLSEIRALPNPPLVELKDEDIHVRRCRLAGDAIDGHFGCFRTSDLERLLQLTHGAPALIGHDRQSIAVARFFGGSIETHNGHHYITPKFFWPKAHSQAEDFRVLLDTGLITEASIAFTFKKPACSICGCDIRDCEHEPGTMYGKQLCHYWYDGVDRVLEGSFVYRGSEPGTGILATMADARDVIKGRKRVTIRFGGKLYEAVAIEENMKSEI